jgi:hypothetical protein
LREREDTWLLKQEVGVQEEVEQRQWPLVGFRTGKHLEESLDLGRNSLSTLMIGIEHFPEFDLS